MSFSNEPTFDEPKTDSIEKALGTSLRVSSSQNILTFINFVHSSHSRASCWQNLHTLITVFTNNSITLQKYQCCASIILDAPDTVVLCSKLCWHNPTDPT